MSLRVNQKKGILMIWKSDEEEIVDFLLKPLVVCQVQYQVFAVLMPVGVEDCDFPPKSELFSHWHQQESLEHFL